MSHCWSSVTLVRAVTETLLVLIITDCEKFFIQLFVNVFFPNIELRKRFRNICKYSWLWSSGVITALLRETELGGWDLDL